MDFSATIILKRVVLPGCNKMKGDWFVISEQNFNHA